MISPKHHRQGQEHQHELKTVMIDASRNEQGAGRISDRGDDHRRHCDLVAGDDASDTRRQRDGRGQQHRRPCHHRDELGLMPSNHSLESPDDAARHQIGEPRPVHRHSACAEAMLREVTERLSAEPVADLLQPHQVVGIGQAQRRQVRPVAPRPYRSQHAGKRQRDQHVDPDRSRGAFHRPDIAAHG